MRNGRSIYVTALDFKNAFGSVSHEMILNCLKQKGFPDAFIKLIQNVYTGSTTRIHTCNFVSSDIDIKKGTKQGCPVSPLLFNLCLEPLFNAIYCTNRDDGYWIHSSKGDTSFNVLAYADDILLISETESGMSNLLRTCESFCDYSKMILAPTKSCSFAYTLKNNIRCDLSHSFTLNNVNVPYVGLDDSIRYLGVPIAVRKFSKLKSSSDYFIKFKDKAMKIFESDLLITQKIHALKTFIIPSLDFILSNGQLKIKHAEAMDRFVSTLINNSIHGNLPLAVKHGSWKDGGLSVPSIKEKLSTCSAKSLIKMLTNKDDHIRILAFSAIEGEKRIRHIQSEYDSQNQTFLDWKADANEHSGTNSIGQRARKAMSKLDLTLKESTGNDSSISNFDHINDNDLQSSLSSQRYTLELNDTSLDKSIKFDSCKKISLFLTTCRRDRWKLLMQKKSFHLHSMFSFNENPLSNSYLLRQHNPICDALFKFAIKSRTNLLGTPEVNELFNNLPHTYCPSCANQNKQSIQSLAHLLNGCISRFPQYTERHDKVQSILIEYVRKLPEVEEIFTNHTVQIPNIPDDLKLLRPDIVAWHASRPRCTILEVSVPYAGFNWGYDTLKKVYEHKKDKYMHLIEFIRSQGIVVNFHVVIVSSLGAVFKDSITDLNRLLLDRKACKILIKRLSAVTIWSSFKIWNTDRSTQIPPQDAIDDEDSPLDSEEGPVFECRGEYVLDLDDTLDESNEVNYVHEDTPLESDPG